MIPVVDRPETINSGDPILRIDMRQMDPEDIQVMLEQSRDGFYSNKELAPIREYATNARDAHVRAGKPTLPIRVTLPTELEPEFKIRDFGAGLSIEEITNIYFRYWKSTKRFTNDENGCLGIGSKSAFGYTAVYTVTSWAEGMKTVITGQKSGFADVIYRQPKPADEPDGLEVTIPVLQKDVDKFQLEAINLFKFWDIRPDFVNLDEKQSKEEFSVMDEKPFLSGEGWSIRPAGYGDGQSVALMGYVPYPIDWNQVRNSLSRPVARKIEGIFEFLSSNLTVLEFPNGTLAFTPNRESLQYNDNTVNVLSDRLVAIYDTLLNMITSKISEAKNIWEAKIIYNRIFRKELEGFESFSSGFKGDLSAVERLLSNRILWNGISIQNGLFSDLHYWDKNSGLVTGKVYGSQMVLSTYVLDEDKKKVKKCRCNRRYNNKMIAAPNSLVLVMDIRKPRLVQAAVHYYLLKLKDTPYSHVYVLNLTEAKVKEDFFRNYHFDSVPATYLSTIADEMKKYLKANTTNSNTGNSGNNSGGSKPLYCSFFSVKNRRDGGYITTPYWESSADNVRGITGGVYVVLKNVPGSGNRIMFNGDLDSLDGSRWMIQALHELCRATGHNLDRVYGIHERTVNAIWFKKAVEAGHWISLEKLTAELVEKLDASLTLKSASLLEADDNKKIGLYFSKQIVKEVTDKTSPISKYAQTMVDLGDNINIAECLKHFQPNLKKLATDKEMDTLLEEIVETYPMLFLLDKTQALTSHSGKDTYNRFTPKELETVIAYINSVDSSLTK